MGQSSSKKNFKLQETIEPVGVKGSIIRRNGEDRPDGISKSSSQAHSRAVSTAAADNNVSMTTNPPTPALSNVDKVIPTYRFYFSYRCGYLCFGVLIKLQGYLRNGTITDMCTRRSKKCCDDDKSTVLSDHFFFSLIFSFCFLL